MLNISENSIKSQIQLEDFKSAKLLRKSRLKRLPLLLILLLLLGSLLSLFVPWTQNIQAKGYVTTRSPEQRPQSIQSVISGRLEKWYVREGDFVSKGDTVVFISEVKSEYFDPDLIERTNEQALAKSQSMDSYGDKIKALENQYAAIKEGLELKKKQNDNKIEQNKNKVLMDSIDLVAYQTNLKIAQNQFERTTELYDKGLKSLTELQAKELKLQETQAKATVQENKLLNQKNILANLYIERSTIIQDYNNKMAKSQSEKQSALSSQLDASAQSSKLQNQISNYSARQKFYYVTAPQSGYITKTLKKGIGEIIKAATSIATIMPEKYDLAVEIYVKPQDIPLLKIGNDVRLRFDGWPAIVIRGWPKSSTGVFPGEVLAIDQFIGENGYYRMLIGPTVSQKPWPEALRVGTGANTFVLLNDVPLWYEIWRQLNGFPPDFYQKENRDKTDVKRKAPIKSIK